MTGDQIGGRIGETDTVGPAADTPQPEASHVSLFDIGNSIDVAYLRIERTMPDEVQRAAFRAEAQGRIP